MTLSPEVSFGKSNFSRPVIRFYVTHSFWNDANKDTTNTGSLLAKLGSNDGTALRDKNSETQTGFQAEAWF